MWRVVGGVNCKLHPGVRRRRSKGKEMEISNCRKVCVTGGSGYIGSWLVKKLLEKGHTVHATLRNLGDTSKVSFLKSLPNADTRLVLFQADIYNSDEFEPAIKGCEYVFHVATPLLHTPQSTQYKDTTEAAVAGVKTIADSCLRSPTVKRLIYTASVMALSPLKEDGFGFKSCLDESCWTPLNLSYKHSNDWTLAYVKSKTLAEKEVLSYNEDIIKSGDHQLEVVSLTCGLVGGGTLQHYVSGSMGAVLSQITGNLIQHQALMFLQELLGTIPLIHVDDVCEAHIFCMEKPIMKGRFLCSAVNATIKELADFYRQNYPEFNITEDLTGGVVEVEEGSGCKRDNSKLVKEGFEYKYDLKKIIDDTVDSGRRLGVLV